MRGAIEAEFDAAEFLDGARGAVREVMRLYGEQVRGGGAAELLQPRLHRPARQRRRGVAAAVQPRHCGCWHC